MCYDKGVLGCLGVSYGVLGCLVVSWGFQPDPSQRGLQISLGVLKAKVSKITDKIIEFIHKCGFMVLSSGNNRCVSKRFQLNSVIILIIDIRFHKNCKFSIINVTPPIKMYSTHNHGLCIHSTEILRRVLCLPCYECL